MPFPTFGLQNGKTINPCCLKYRSNLYSSDSKQCFLSFPAQAVPAGAFGTKVTQPMPQAPTLSCPLTSLHTPHTLSRHHAPSTMMPILQEAGSCQPQLHSPPHPLTRALEAGPYRASPGLGAGMAQASLNSLRANHRHRGHCLFIKYFLGPSCGPGPGGTACWHSRGHRPERITVIWGRWGALL